MSNVSYILRKDESRPEIDNFKKTSLALLMASGLWDKYSEIPLNAIFEEHRPGAINFAIQKEFCYYNGYFLIRLEV